MKICLQLNTSHGTKIPTSLPCKVLITCIHLILSRIPFRWKCCCTRSRWIRSVKRCSCIPYTVFEHKNPKVTKKYLPPAQHTHHEHNDLRPAAHCCTARTDPQIITQFTGSMSMDNSILQHGLERRHFFFSHRRSPQLVAFASSYQYSLALNVIT